MRYSRKAAFRAWAERVKGWWRLCVYIFLTTWVGFFAAMVTADGIASRIWLKAALGVAIGVSVLACLFRLWRDRRGCFPAVLVAGVAAFALLLAGGSLSRSPEALKAEQTKRRAQFERMLKEYARHRKVIIEEEGSR